MNIETHFYRDWNLRLSHATVNGWYICQVYCGDTFYTTFVEESSAAAMDKARGFIDAEIEYQWKAVQP